jgi:PKD domain
MGALRATATAVLIFTAAAAASAQCLSEARVISTRRSDPNLVSGPSAFGGGVLAVAKSDPTTRRIFVGTYDEHFNPLTPDVLAGTDSPDGPLALIWNGVDFGLFYRTRASQRLVLQRISKSGDPIGTPIPVSSRVFDLREEADVIWSPLHNAYVVATTFEPNASRDVFITLLSREGIVQRDENTHVYAAYEAAWLNVAVAADGTIGVFYMAADETIVMAHVTAAPGAYVDHVWTSGRDLHVTAIGNEFYLVKQVQVGDKTELRWLVINSLGQAVEPDRLLVAPFGIDIRPLGLTANGEELALSYLDADRGFGVAPGYFRLRRFTTEGTVISDSEFAISDPAQAFAFSEHDFIWTGSSYISPAVLASGRDVDSLLIRHCPLRARITAPSTEVVRNEFVTFTAVAEGGAPGYTYQWNSGDSSIPFVGPTLRYRYIHNGTYTVTLTVTDQSGVVAVSTFTVKVVEKIEEPEEPPVKKKRRGVQH